MRQLVKPSAQLINEENEVASVDMFNESCRSKDIEKISEALTCPNSAGENFYFNKSEIKKYSPCVISSHVRSPVLVRTFVARRPEITYFKDITLNKGELVVANCWLNGKNRKCYIDSCSDTTWMNLTTMRHLGLKLIKMENLGRLEGVTPGFTRIIGKVSIELQFTSIIYRLEVAVLDGCELIDGLLVGMDFMKPAKLKLCLGNGYLEEENGDKKKFIEQQVHHVTLRAFRSECITACHAFSLEPFSEKRLKFIIEPHMTELRAKNVSKNGKIVHLKHWNRAAGIVILIVQNVGFAPVFVMKGDVIGKAFSIRNQA